MGTPAHCGRNGSWSFELAYGLETHVKQVLGRGELCVAELRPGLCTVKGGSVHDGILSER
jgi:hypothetical protein